MKILISHFGVYKKGGWGRSFPLAKGLASLGQDITLITTNPKVSFLIKKEKIDDVNVIIFPDFISRKLTSKGFGFLSLFLKVLYSITHKYDIVHSDVGHRPSSGVPCRINKRLYHSIYIAEWWDFFGIGGQYDNKTKLFKVVFGRYELKWELLDKIKANGIVVLSKYLEAKALTFKEKEKVELIHGGVDLDRVSYIENNKSLKEKLGISDKCITFGYLDAYDRTLDDLNAFIEAITDLSSLIQIKLLVYGMNLSSSVKGKLKDFIIEFGWVDFPEDNDLFSATDVFLLFKEDNIINKAGWPNKVGEYMACGRPILMNPVGEMIGFAQKFKESIITVNNDKEEIKKIILYLYNNKRALIEMGKKNRLIAEESLSWSQRSKNLLEFYKKINKDEATNTTT